MNKPEIHPRSCVVVAAAIIQRNGKILLSRRKTDVHQGGFWEFPGGKKEPGETLTHCLRRELKEELDIQVSDPQFFCSLRHRYPDKEVELHFFFCSLIHGNPKALACTELAWVHPQNISSYSFPLANLPILKKITQGQLRRMDCS